MASGKTIEMIDLSKANEWRTPTDRPKRERDRRLSGKARRKERRLKTLLAKLARLAEEAEPSWESTPTD